MYLKVAMASGTFLKTRFKDSGNQIELYDKLVTLVPKRKVLVKNLISTVINKVEDNI